MKFISPFSGKELEWIDPATDPERIEMNEKYILDEQGNPVVCDDLMTWAKFMQNDGSRRVASDHVGDVHVSTVFLALDHSFGQGPPVLYESMIFGGEHDGDMERYSTKEEALKGHAEMLAKVSLPH